MAENVVEVVARFDAKFTELTTKLENIERAVTRKAAAISGRWDKVTKSFASSGKAMRSFGNDVSAWSGSILRWTSVATAGLLGMAGAVLKIQSNFEDAFADVRKTVNATEDEFKRLEQDLIDLSKVIPVSTEELARLMGVAGQMGVEGRDNLLAFTKTAAELGRTTDMSSEEAVGGLAALITKTQGTMDQVDELGSALNSLGAKSNAGEKNILDMSLRVASAGRTAKMTQQEILALSTALASMKVESEMGGSALSRIISQMSLAASGGEVDPDKLERQQKRARQLDRMRRDTLREIRDAQDEYNKVSRQRPKASNNWYDATENARDKRGIIERVERLKEKLGEIDAATASVNQKMADLGGNKKLEQFASVAGMSADAFKDIIKSSPYEALRLFFKGLDDAQKKGQDLNVVLSQMGYKEVRLLQVLKDMAAAQGQMSGNLNIANTAYKENNSLTKEAEQRFKTLSGMLGIAWNRIKGIALGVRESVEEPLKAALKDTVLPLIAEVAEWVKTNGPAIGEQVKTTVEAIVKKLRDAAQWVRENKEWLEKWAKILVTTGPKVLGLALAVGILGKGLSVVLGLGGLLLQGGGKMMGAGGWTLGKLMGKKGAAKAAGGALAAGAEGAAIGAGAEAVAGAGATVAAGKAASKGGGLLAKLFPTVAAASGWLSKVVKSALGGAGGLLSRLLGSSVKGVFSGGIMATAAKTFGAIAAVEIAFEVGTAVGNAIYRNAPEWMPGSQKWNAKKGVEQQERDRATTEQKVGMDERIDAYVKSHPGVSRDEARRKIEAAQGKRDSVIASARPAATAAPAGPPPSKTAGQDKVAAAIMGASSIQSPAAQLRQRLAEQNPGMAAGDLGSLYKREAIRMGIEKPHQMADRVGLPNWAAKPTQTATDPSKWTAFETKLASIRTERDALRGKTGGGVMVADAKGAGAAGATNNVSNNVTINVASDGTITGNKGALEKLGRIVGQYLTNDALAALG